MASRSLGTLTVDLVTKIGGFTSGLTKAERELAKSSKEMEARARKIGASIGTALTVGFTALAGATALIIKNTIDASREQAQLEAVLKSTGGAAGLSQQQLNGMADALQQVSTFAAGNITEMQSVLLTFTKIQGDVFPKAQQAVLDMATALGTDLQAAAIQVGKALNDPIKGATALGRAGVQFSEDQKEMIKALVETGNVAEAQTLILAELETQFGGSAAAASNTLGGALTVLKNNFNDLLEGDAGGEGVKGTVTAIKDLSTLLTSQSVKDGFQAIISGAATAAGTVAQFAAQIANLTKQVAEQLAANVGGIGGDDITRLEAEATRLRAKLEEQQSRFVLVDIGKNEDKIKADIAKVEAQLSSFYERSAQAAQGRLALLATPANAFQDGATEVINAGAGFGTGRPTAGGGGASKGASAAQKAAADAARDREKAEADLAARLEEMDKLQASYNTSLDDFQAQLDGPLAVAELEHVRRIAETQDLLDQGIITVDEATRAQLLYGEAIKKTRDELDPYGAQFKALLEDMDLELELMGKTNSERIVELELRRLGIDLSTKEGEAAAAAIRSRAEQLEATAKQISAMDEFRSSFEDNVAGVLDGSKSIKDALRDLVSDTISQFARLAAQNFTESLFGQTGTSQTGSAGGFLSSLFGSFFGGARASGGPMYPGKAYLVGENGPELVTPRGASVVTSASETSRLAGAGGGSVINNFNMPGRYDMRTQAQVAADAGRASRRALARGTA